MKEYWNSLLTEKSWLILQGLAKEYDFILIGGWAVFLFTKAQKSKDIDIIVSIKELEKLKKENLNKNDNLKKYEIKREEIDIDIYLEYFSKLAIPVEDIKNYTTFAEGFKVIIPELLLILKQKAFLDRKNSIKGEKDKLDILSLIFFSGLELKKYWEIVKKYNLTSYTDELKNLIKDFKDYDSLGMTPKELKKTKENAISALKSFK
ncbi:MAG: hypothetical protein KKA64_02870 [Nanoarchaeota archaeon]|nr:hypothetical protein [Nanoarchaeota archaeon]